MLGLVPSIHAVPSEMPSFPTTIPVGLKDVDPRHKAEDDDWRD
jgi:hypothetical protein